jgi:hypothetical protein
MSSTTQPTDFSDIYTDILNKIRADTGQSTTVVQAKRLANTALHDIVFGLTYKLPWLERRATLLTMTPYTTGTVAISVGGTSLVGTDTLWNTNNDYGVKNLRNTSKLTISGGTDIYKAGTPSTDTAVTISPRYVASAAASGATYIAFEDEYALASDFLRPVDLQFFSDNRDISLISRKDFRRAFPRPNVSGRPRHASIVDDAFSGSATPVRRVQLYPYPDQTYVLPYTYITSNLAVSALGVEATAMSADTDQPNLPLQYRHGIVLYALYNFFRDKRDDARSQEVKAEYTDFMLRLTSDIEVGTHTKAQIQPNMGVYWRNAKRPYRTGAGGRFSINNSFDRFER